MSQMTVDMAQRIVRHWREKKTHYGITAWEECQLAAAFLHAQGQPIVDLSDLAPTEPEALHAIGEADLVEAVRLVIPSLHGIVLRIEGRAGFEHLRQDVAVARDTLATALMKVVRASPAQDKSHDR